MTNFNFFSWSFFLLKNDIAINWTDVTINDHWDMSLIVLLFFPSYVFLLKMGRTGKINPVWSACYCFPAAVGHENKWTTLYVDIFRVLNCSLKGNGICWVMCPGSFKKAHWFEGEYIREMPNLYKWFRKRPSFKVSIVSPVLNWIYWFRLLIEINGIVLWYLSL